MGADTLALEIQAQWVAGSLDKRIVAFSTTDGRSSVGIVVDVYADYLVLSNVGQVANTTIRYPALDISGALPNERQYISIDHIVSWGILA